MVLSAILGWAPSARAFERQWHLGAAVGWVVPSEVYDGGGSVGLHAAYGVSDMFDVRVELRGSLHPLSIDTGRRNTLWQATGGLAYKLDIIEWVPYLGVRAGYYRFGEDLPAGIAGAYGGDALRRQGGVIGTMVGVDYAFSRSAALGVELDYDALLPRGSVVGALIRAEYRWGF